MYQCSFVFSHSSRFDYINGQRILITIAIVFSNQKHNFEHNRLILGIMLKSIIGNSKSTIGSGLVVAVYIAK